MKALSFATAAVSFFASIANAAPAPQDDTVYGGGPGPVSLTTPLPSVTPTTPIIIGGPGPVQLPTTASILSFNPGGPISLVPTCTTTVLSPLSITHGPTSTVFQSTITITELLNCSGCALQTQHLFAPIPIVYTTTVTADLLVTQQEFACSPSPNPLKK